MGWAKRNYETAFRTDTLDLASGKFGSREEKKGSTHLQFCKLGCFLGNFLFLCLYFLFQTAEG